MFREIVGVTKSIIVRYAEGFVELKDSLDKESDRYKELEEINYSLEMYRGVFFKILREIMGVAQIDAEIINALPHDNVGGINGECKDVEIDEETYEVLLSNTRGKLMSCSKIRKEIKKNKNKIYALCVMHFNEVLKEIGIYECMQ